MIFASMPDILNASVAQPRFRTFLLGLLATMALVLAATGFLELFPVPLLAGRMRLGSA